MAKANWEAADELQSKIPHTFTAVADLVMAMADAHKNKGKTSLFGHDNGLTGFLCQIH